MTATTRAADDNVADLLRRHGASILRRWRQAMAASASIDAGRLEILAAGAEAVVLAAAANPAAPAEDAVGAMPPGELLAAHRTLRKSAIEELHESRAGDASHGPALLARLDEQMGRQLLRAVDAQLHELRVATESQARFLSYLSHDLRGTLNGVILMVEVLRRELVNRPEFAESLTDLQLMRDINHGRRGDDGASPPGRPASPRKIEPHRRAVNLPALLHDVVNRAKAAADQKGVQVVADIAKGASLTSNPEIVRLAIENLMGNAIKHADRMVRVTAVARDGKCVLSVSDDGPGIPAERLRELLDPLRRLQIKGIGLGLSIAQFAAKTLGGELLASSQPGSGSTFEIAIPA